LYPLLITTFGHIEIPGNNRSIYTLHISISYQTDDAFPLESTVRRRGVIGNYHLSPGPKSTVTKKTVSTSNMSRSIGRHDVVMVKSTRPSSTADWERDTIGNDGRTWIRLVAHRRDFWLRDRYEEDPLKATTTDVKETEGERSGPSQTSEPSAIPASEDRMPEQESLTMEQMEVQAYYENEYSRGLRESPVVPDPSYDVDSLSTREYNKRKTHADNVEKTRKRVVDSLQDKFDGSILQLSVHPSQQPQGRDLLDRGLAAYDSEAAVALRERIAGWDTDDGDKTDLAKRHAELLDMVARGLVGETYTPLFSARPRDGDYTSDLYVPDIVVWTVTAPGSRDAAISGVTRIEAIDDLKPRASDDLAFRVVSTGMKREIRPNSTRPSESTS
jgi:hypothetical protein